MVIVKVQVAIFPVGGPGLLYDQELTFAERRSLTPNEMQALGKDVKGYFEAQKIKDDNGELHWLTSKRVANQNW
jgi:hypothetical protein